MVQHFNLHGEKPPKIDILQAIYLIASAWDSVTTDTIRNCWTKANITTSPSSIPVTLDQHLTESFISAQRQGFLQAWTTLDGKCDNPDLINSYFDDTDEEFDTPGPTEKGVEFPDVIAIVERGINAGVLHCPVNQLDKIDYESKPEELQPVPIPLIGLETAIHYTGELTGFLHVTGLLLSNEKVQ